MTHYALKMSDGSIAIMETLGNAKPEDCLASWPDEHRTNVISHHPIDPKSIPADRTRRHKWRLNGNRIEAAQE